MQSFFYVSLCRRRLVPAAAQVAAGPQQALRVHLEREMKDDDL